MSNCATTQMDYMDASVMKIFILHQMDETVFQFVVATSINPMEHFVAQVGPTFIHVLTFSASGL